MEEEEKKQLKRDMGENQGKVNKRWARVHRITSSLAGWRENNKRSQE